MFIRFYNGSPTLDAWDDKSPRFIDGWRPCERVVEAPGGMVLTYGHLLRLFDADGESFMEMEIGRGGYVLLDGIYYGDFEVGNERQSEENRPPLLQWAIHQSDTRGAQCGWEIIEECGSYTVYPRPMDENGCDTPDCDEDFAEAYRLARESGVACDSEGRLIGLHPSATTSS